LKSRPTICFLTGSSADWSGASRVLYTTLLTMDLTRVEPLVLLSGDGSIKTELEARGIRCLVWGPATEPENKVAYVKSLFRTLYLLRRERIAALHINHRFWRPAEVLAALLLRIPVLVHFHVVNRQEGSFMDHCRAAICVSRYVAAESVPNALRKEVIYNPVHLARFKSGENLRSKCSIPPDAVVIAFVGQIREIKGVQDFIAMARRIPNPDARFLIAGECRDPKKFSGSYSEHDLKQMIGDDARIRYIGYVKEVENVYHSADIIVVPSRWQEPLGLINLEAAACQKPVVATRVGGIPEVVHDGINGYLVEAGDVEALSERVSRLGNDPALRLRLGTAGRRSSGAEFHQPACKGVRNAATKLCAALSSR
jgi:glycosyltransferase involved in cell wall biosynthesis